MEKAFRERIDAAVDSLGTPEMTSGIGIVLGSGLGDFAGRVPGVEVPYSSIKGFPVPTVSGHGGVLKLGSGLALLSGRVHYYEGGPLDDVVFPVFLLHRLGIRTLILTNAAGGINRNFSPGDLVLIRDHINLMGVNPLRGPNQDLGPRFPDMSGAYSPGLRALAREASGMELRDGVYAALSGPSYETPAEIRMLAVLGADMVGMSTVPEAIAARYLGIEVLGISCITNMAAGTQDSSLDHAEVIARGGEAAPRFSRLVESVVVELGRRPRDR
jgi:purine-nucleoside phosphorylase